jgi:hypothetical protein
LLVPAWIAAARVRSRLARRPEPREELIRRHAPGHSFADIGCMWNVDGALAFLAEEAGATSVTGLDLMPPTARYESTHRARASSVRFVHGDVHDEEAMRAVGTHDVVWCAGVIYHAPNPLLTLERLRSITGQLLILATETIPEVPALRQACVFYPCLDDHHRRAHAAARPGLTALGISERFERSQGYGAWWWGISRSALRGMLRATGFEPIEESGGPLHVTVLARPCRE